MSDTRISGCQLLARARPAAALLAHSTTAPQRVNMNFSISHVSSRSEEHTSELQSLAYLVCRLLLEKKKIILKCLYRLRRIIVYLLCRRRLTGKQWLIVTRTKIT